MSAAPTDPPAGVAASAGPAEPGPAFADALFDALGAVALVIDAHGRIVRMNRAAEQLSGHASEQACGEPFYWTRFIPPEERVQVRGWFEAMRSRSIEPEATNHWIGADGRRHLLRWSNTILDDANGEPAYLIAVGTDISEQVRLTRLSSRLAAYRSFLAQVSQAMARAESDTELLRVVCDLAVRHAGVRLAWVGVPDASSRMQVVGGAGPALGYLDGIDVSVDPQQVSGQGSAGRCWREARAYFNLSFSADPMLHAWRERGEAHGLQASAVLPIRRGRAMLAVLLLYSDEPDYFDAALQELLLELVDDIERGLDHLQLRQMNKVLVDHTDAAVAVVQEGRCLFANSRMAQLFGHSDAAQLVGMSMREAFADDAVWERAAAMEPDARDLRLQAVPMRRRDGTLLCCDLIGVRLDAQRSVWTALDVSARESQRLQSEQLQRLYRALLSEGDVVLRARDEGQMVQQTCERLVQDTPFHAAALRRPDAQGWLQTLAKAGQGSAVMEALRVHVDDAYSPAAEAWRSARPVLRNANLHVPGDEAWRGLMRSQGWESALAVPVRRAGRVWAVLVFAAPVRDAFDARTLQTCEQVCQLLGHGLDELDLKQRLRSMQAEEAHRARHDALTSLPNRFALEQHLPQAMARAARRCCALAVGLIDLDDFKPVNDSFGHAAGDLLLQQLAQRLRRLLRAGDFIARLGGDEFVVVIEDLDAEQAVLQLDIALRRLHRAVETAFDLGQDRIGSIGMSMGLAVHPGHGDDAAALLRHADVAMYQVKAAKQQRLRWWQLAQPQAQAQA